MNPEALPEFDGHELVKVFHDRASGLVAIIAVHSTSLGPATGGTRYYQYGAMEDALRDALSLSRAMTYKCALAGVPYGGGKGVIVAQPGHPKTPALLRAYAAKVNSLGGYFSTGEDVGLTQQDIEIMAEVSPHINGVRGAEEVASSAAFGVFLAIKAAMEHGLGNSIIAGKRIAIKGLGKVGWALAQYIHAEGGSIIAAEIDPVIIAKAKVAFPGITFTTPERIIAEPADVYSPCALGNEFTEATARMVNAGIICGAANNQLASAAVAEVLYQAGIIYIPDFVANAGGLISIVAERNKGGYEAQWVTGKIHGIADAVLDILSQSRTEEVSPNSIAERMAGRILRKEASYNAISAVA